MFGRFRYFFFWDCLANRKYFVSLHCLRLRTMKYPIGIQNFEKLRREGYVYVDKTALMYKMISEGSYYFLSRPRRFGKSLMVSTLDAFFSGKKNLFEGLYVDTVDWEWKEYPILHLDLNVKKYETKEDLDKILNRHLEQWEQRYDSPYTDRDLEERFLQVVELAHQKTGLPVVILVDEYDKPLLQAIGNEALQTEYRNTLKAFYGVLKSCDAHIKFAFLTGVTKFGKVSVFSDLNNLIDISLDYEYNALCGITEQELLNVFPESIESLARRNGLSREECIAMLRRMYDGYHFEETAPGVYNPFSVLNTFQKNKFGSYWFETGTPTYLVYLLRHHYYDLEAMAHAEITTDVLNSIDSTSSNPIPVIYQSGYLTIKGFDERFKKYILGFPNEEVEEGLVKYLTPYYLDNIERSSAFDVGKFSADVESGKPEQFLERLKSLFASAPYDSITGDKENHFQNMMWVVFKMMGFYSHTEYHTSDGRIDLLIEKPLYRYVMEFKLDGTAEEALKQIKSNNYSLQFQLDDKKTFLVGVNFSRESRTIENYVIA